MEIAWQIDAVDGASAASQQGHLGDFPYRPNRLPCNACIGAGYALQTRTRDSKCGTKLRRPRRGRVVA
jgi:hypothetical protein